MHRLLRQFRARGARRPAGAPAGLGTLIFLSMTWAGPGLAIQGSGDGEGSDGGPTDRWYQVLWQGTPAGWTHEVEEARDPSGGGAVERSESLLRVSRLGTPVTLWSLVEYRPPWKDRRASCTFTAAQVGVDTSRAICRFDPDSIRVVKGESGNRRYALGLPPDFRRPEELDSLWAPSPDRQELRYSTFLPEMDAVLPFAARKEGLDTLFLGGERRAAWRFRIRCLSVPALESLEWHGADGALVKSELPALGLVTLLATREEALASGEAVELIRSTLIPLDRPLESLQPYRRVVFRIRTAAASRPFRPLAGPALTILSQADTGCVVASVRLDPPGGPTPPPPQEGAPLSAAERIRALQATSLLEVDDPAIRKAALRAGAAEADPWKRALRLEKFVSTHVQTKDLRVLFASAARTLASGEGDCTEHAMLLTALARATGLPARVVAGLVAQGNQMAFHLWTEVDAGRGWIGLDAALDRAPTDGRYLPLAASDLADESLGPLYNAILEALAGLRVEVVEAEPLGKGSPQ